MFNSLPIVDPDGSELIVAWKDGKPVLIPFYKLQALAAPVISSDPTSFTASVFGSYQIDLAWSGSADNYVIERCRDNDGNWIEIYSGHIASFSDDTLAPECDYYYRLRAQEAGKFDSNYVFDNDSTPALP